ncbi:MAG TPA: HAMP domain-containing sensor histidine kinase [Streptosporangiaceae bacterium]|jgi:two-component system OmpR family sensor kinase|nr:HAMP domain-containing sensor histidine kinase [Streptosporangiaceae bacterium]
MLRNRPVRHPALLRRLGRAQLRTRVLAGVLAIMLAALVAFDFAAVTALRGYLLGHTDEQLQEVMGLYRAVDAPVAATPAVSRVMALSRAAGGGQSQIEIPVTASWQPAAVGHAQLSALRTAVTGWVILGPRVRLHASVLDQYYVAYTSAATQIRLVHGNPDLIPSGAGSWGEPVPAFRTVVSLNGRVQLRLQTVPVAGGQLIASTSLAAVNKTVDRLGMILTIGSVAAALVAGLGVAWLMRRGLRPIETMADEADRITAGDLTDRVGQPDTRTEVGRLGAALNGMLARIETSIAEREVSQQLTRRFFADASHELRNPLASLRANAELYQQGVLRRRPQVDEAMRRIAAEAQRMSGLVDDMLRLARLDQLPDQHHEPVDMSAVVRGCAQRARAADPQRTWRTRVSSGLGTAGDEELLRRAVDNLLANVQAHTPAGTVATISAARCGDSVVVEVSDDGPGVPAGQLDRIFDRFYRGAAPAHRPGSGLGLAIVSAVAAAHDGLASAALGTPHGLRITVTLPAATGDSPEHGAEDSTDDSDSVLAGAPEPAGAGVRYHQ